MKKLKDAKGADYAVGYGKPPADHRFEPGRSGNPKGRPKGSKSVTALLQKELSARATVIEGGVERIVELRRLLVRGMVRRGVKGDTKAADWVLRHDSAYHAERSAQDAEGSKVGPKLLTKTQMEKMTDEELDIIIRAGEILGSHSPE